MGLRDRFKGTVEKGLMGDFLSLRGQHEELVMRMAELEHKTQAATEWLSAQQTAIIRGYHMLARAIRNGNAQEARHVLQMPAAVAIIHLPVPADVPAGVESFRQWSDLVFDGRNKERVDADFNALPSESLPVEVLEKAAAAMKKQQEALTKPEEEPEYGFWKRMTGAAEKELREKIAHEKEALFSLQTRAPYYVDSFFDWVNTAVDPQEGGPFDNKKDNEGWMKLQESYKDPYYTVRLAERDFIAATETRIQQFGAISKDYDVFSANLESGDAARAIKALDHFKDSGHFKDMLAWLMESHDCASLADFALKNFDKRTDQALVFDKAVDVEEKISYRRGEADSVANVFYKVFGEAIKKDDPLPFSVVDKTLDWLVRMSEPDSNKLAEALFPRKSEPMSPASSFVPAVQAYRAEPEKLADLLSIMVRSKDSHLMLGYASLIKALDDKDGVALESLLKAQTDEGLLQKTLDFAKFVEPGFELSEKLVGSFAGTRHLAPLLDMLLTAGQPLLPNRSARAVVEDVAVKGAISAANPLPVALVGRIVDYYHSKKSENITQLLLKKEGGAPHLLEQIVQGNLKDSPLGWELLTTVLKPIDGSLARASILFNAADTALQADNARFLREAAEMLAGKYIRYSESGLLNPARGSAIWYEEVSGKGGHSVLKMLTDESAIEIPGTREEKNAGRVINVLSRRDDMLMMESEIFKTENVDAFYPGRVDGHYYYTACGRTYAITNDQARYHDLIKKVKAEHPGFYMVDDILINTNRVQYVTRETNRVQYVTREEGGINLHGDQRTTLVPMSESQMKQFFQGVITRDGWISSDVQALNMKKATSLWPSEDNKEICFVMQGKVYDSSLDQETVAAGGVRNEILPAAEYLQTVAKNKDFVQVGSKVYNLNDVFSAEYDSAEGAFEYQADGNKTQVTMTSAQAKAIFRKMAAHGDFWMGEDMNSAVNLGLAENALLHEKNGEAVLVSAGAVFAMNNVHLEEFVATAQKKGGVVVGTSKSNDWLEGTEADVIWPARIVDLKAIKEADGREMLMFVSGAKSYKVPLADKSAIAVLDRLEQAARESTGAPDLAGKIADMVSGWKKTVAHPSKTLEGLGDIAKHNPDSFLKTLRETKKKSGAALDFKGKAGSRAVTPEPAGRRPGNGEGTKGPVQSGRKPPRFL